MAVDIARVFGELGLHVLERGWLSSNNIVFQGRRGEGATVVDTGYDSHAGQTVALLKSHCGEAGVSRVINTHLHSDHCGGNAALQAAWGCEAWVPEVSIDAVNAWDDSRLTFQLTDQSCQRFAARRGLAPGEQVLLGEHRWLVLAAPGHDPESTMLFEPRSRVLISADALWESRLAIIFPELDGRPGFAAARSVLETIEALNPSVVIPGHGAPFSDVGKSLGRSRERLNQFEVQPRRHRTYAARALAMFRMLESRVLARQELEQWLLRTPVFSHTREPGDDASLAASQLVDRLVADRLLLETGDGRLEVA